MERPGEEGDIDARCAGALVEQTRIVRRAIEAMSRVEARDEKKEKRKTRPRADANREIKFDYGARASAKIERMRSRVRAARAEFNTPRARRLSPPVDLADIDNDELIRSLRRRFVRR